MIGGQVGMVARSAIAEGPRDAACHLKTLLIVTDDM